MRWTYMNHMTSESMLFSNPCPCLASAHRALTYVYFFAADSNTGKWHGSDLPAHRCICTRKQRHGCHAFPTGEHILSLSAGVRHACTFIWTCLPFYLFAAHCQMIACDTSSVSCTCSQTAWTLLPCIIKPIHHRSINLQNSSHAMPYFAKLVFSLHHPCGTYNLKVCCLCCGSLLVLMHPVSVLSECSANAQSPDRFCIKHLCNDWKGALVLRSSHL